MTAKLQPPKEQWGNPAESQANGADVRLLPSANGGPHHDPLLADSTELALQQLAAAAEQGSEALFLDAKQQIDWSRRPATDFTRAIRWALAAGAHLAARNLATQGAAQYPDHQELQKFAYVLAPPKVIQRKDLPPTSSWKEDRAWLMAHRHEYRGQWVGLRNGQLLASAVTLQAVVDQVGETRCVLFTKVF